MLMLALVLAVLWAGLYFFLGLTTPVVHVLLGAAVVALIAYVARGSRAPRF